MLDLSKVTFSRKLHETIPNTDVVSGTINLRAEIVIAGFDKEQEKAAKEQINHMLWDKFYGDLTTPLMRLERLAMDNPSPGQRELIQSACDELNTLLAKPE